MSWYILRDQEKEGPYSDEELGRLIGAGSVKPHDLLWRPGLTKWMFAADIPDLPSALEHPPVSLYLRPSETENSARETALSTTALVSSSMPASGAPDPLKGKAAKPAISCVTGAETCPWPARTG
jgi:hypothetical protein